MFKHKLLGGLLLLSSNIFIDSLRTEIKYQSSEPVTVDGVLKKRAKLVPVAGIDQADLLKIIEHKLANDELFALFNPGQADWRKFFAGNCKRLLRHASLNGHFAKLYPDDERSSLEYAFFPGTANADKLVIIASGGFYDKQLSLPYIILLNKILGFSCAVADYRGHANSWDKANPKNRLFRMRDVKRAKGVDSSQFTFGRKEGKDFCHLAKLLQEKYPNIKQIHGLGVCFGAIVLAKAYNHYQKLYNKELFASLMLISPLPSVKELVLNLMHDSRALAKFVDKRMVARLASSHWFRRLKKLMRFSIVEKVVLLSIYNRLKINNFNALAEFGKLELPVLCIASANCDYIVNKKMALKVWNAIPSQQKALLWSFGVEHLFNWRAETNQLVDIFKQFFLRPRPTINKFNANLLKF